MRHVNHGSLANAQGGYIGHLVCSIRSAQPLLRSGRLLRLGPNQQAARQAMECYEADATGSDGKRQLWPGKNLEHQFGRHNCCASFCQSLLASIKDSMSACLLCQLHLEKDTCLTLPCL